MSRCCWPQRLQNRVSLQSLPPDGGWVRFIHIAPNWEVCSGCRGALKLCRALQVPYLKAPKHSPEPHINDPTLQDAPSPVC